MSLVRVFAKEEKMQGEKEKQKKKPVAHAESGG
jgi:hypothetical protein